MNPDPKHWDGPVVPDAALVPGVVPGAEQVEAGVGQDLPHVHQPVPLLVKNASVLAAIA
jgi:hypothetical protein